MFGSLFESKHQKLIHKWQEEHKEIEKLAEKVIESYEKNEHNEAKKSMKALKDIAVEHLMDEDIKLFNIIKEESDKLDTQTKALLNDFTSEFKHTKVSLMNFLAKYASPEVALDRSFYRTFKELMDILAQRISFEESNLYSRLKNK